MRSNPFNHRRNKVRFISGISTAVLGGLIAILGGCQTLHVPNSVVAKDSGNDAGSQLSYWHDLAERHLTSNDDAFHGVLLYLDGKDPSKNYDERVATLKKRNLLASNFHQPADMAIERGTIAVIVVKTLDIRGGWVMHVFGVSPRYAVKELVDDEIFTPSSPQQTFSGSEFVGVIGKLEDFQESKVASGSGSTSADVAAAEEQNSH